MGYLGICLEPNELEPLIATLRLDERSMTYFSGLRQQHFPADRNYLPAHITLFHYLPGQREAELRNELSHVCGQFVSFPVAVSGLRNMGKGVGFRLESSGAQRLRQQLAERWWPFLGAQDKQPYHPHITVQNKVTPQAAKQLLAVLQAGFSPWDCQATGVDLWRYLHGPWEHLVFCAFAV